MKKQITITMLAIMMLAGTMAMYAGESYSFETNMTEPTYFVVGNSSNLDGLNITFEDGIITISTVINYKPDNFTLIFYDNATKEVIKIIHTRSSGRTRYVYRNVTVIEEVFIDRNITIVPECTTCNETIVDTEVEVNNFWRNTAWMLGVIVLLSIFFWIISISRTDL